MSFYYNYPKSAVICSMMLIAGCNQHGPNQVVAEQSILTPSQRDDIAFNTAYPNGLSYPITVDTTQLLINYYPNAPKVIEMMNSSDWYQTQAKLSTYRLAIKIPFDTLDTKKIRFFTTCHQDTSNYFCSKDFLKKVTESDNRLFLKKNVQIVLTADRDSADRFNLSLIKDDVVYPSTMLLAPVSLPVPSTQTLPVRYRYLEYDKPCFWGNFTVKGQVQNHQYQCLDIQPIFDLFEMDPLITSETSSIDFTDYGAYPLGRTNYYYFIIPDHDY